MPHFLIVIAGLVLKINKYGFQLNLNSNLNLKNSIILQNLRSKKLNYRTRICKNGQNSNKIRPSSQPRLQHTI